MSEKYLSIQDIMERLQIARSSVYRRVKDGTLPSPIKLGNLRRFKESDVEAALSALKYTDQTDEQGAKQ